MTATINHVIGPRIVRLRFIGSGPWSGPSLLVAGEIRLPTVHRRTADRDRRERTVSPERPNYSCALVGVALRALVGVALRALVGVALRALVGVALRALVGIDLGP